MYVWRQGQEEKSKVSDVDSDQTVDQRTQSRSYSRRVKVAVDDEKHLHVFHKDYKWPPPETLLPLIHPLTNYKTAHERRNLAQIELTIKKITSGTRDMYLGKNWKDIFGKKAQLKELFETAEKGINENRASMVRFNEIIKDNIAQKKALESEIKLTRQLIEDYRHIEKELTRYVDKYSMFEKYLENVAVVDGQSRNVRDILDRYETLQSTSVDCERILREELEEADDIRRKMLMMIEEKSSKLKALSNRLILTEVRRKNARDRRVYWEHMMLRIKYTALDRTQEMLALREGINDLYRTMSIRLRVVPDIPKSEVRAQLDFIHKNVMFYKEVVTIASGMKSPELAKDEVIKKQSTAMK